MKTNYQELLSPRWWLVLGIFSLFIHFLPAQEKWVELPSIPDKEGFAGMYAGVSNDVLIVAGGANFPDLRPWEGGTKVWYDHIFYLEEIDGSWKRSGVSLPSPLAYGVSVNYKDEVIFVGGSDADKHYDKVFSLAFRNGEIVKGQEYPALPTPLSNMCGAIVGDVLYIAGGNQTSLSIGEKKFLALDLSVPVSERTWEELQAWPGASRIQSVAASMDGAFYLFSGFELHLDSSGALQRTLLHDAYRYDPGEDTWTQLPDLPRGVAAAPGGAFTIGLSHIVIPGGLDDETLQFTDQKTHPGFKEEVIAYNTMSEEWVTLSDMPYGASRVTAPTTRWKGMWVVPNGESAPGVRSSKVFGYSNQVRFGWINWLTLCVYIGCMILIGFYFSKRESSTDNYFKAGGRIPWWAAGISIYGTQLSAITFMAVPALVYATDWRLAVGTIMILLIVPLIIKYYLPHFRKMNLTTAYEFLERRFDLKVRMVGSLTFILLQLGRMGVVLYLPAIAISSVTGIDIILCIAIMGVFSTLYTVLGGIEAVIWTDVAQVAVLMGGAVACIIVAVMNIPGGTAEIIDVGVAYQKFRIIDWRWDYTDLVFWVAIIGFFFLNLISYTSDQVVIQRYLTVKDEKAAARSLWTNGIVTIPGIFIFFGLGTTLFVYYLTNPQEISSNTTDEILPYFVVTKLPVGVAGLVISGIFAASMSSLDSSMNSISTAYITDFHKNLWPGKPDAQYLRIAKGVTILMGAFGTLTAVWIALSDIGFIFDFFQEILGTIGGSLAGVFVLAVFVRRTTPTGALMGILGGALITLWAKNFTEINGYFYGAIGVMSCVAIGYLVSVLLGDRSGANKVQV